MATKNNYRKFILDTGKEIIAGRNAITNDSLVFESNPKDILLHTLAPGSPFVNVGEDPKKSEIKQAAIFCASKSQEWRDTKKDIVVNWFYKKNTTKNKKDKAGLWHTKHEGKIIAKKSEVTKLMSN
jgi:predicted ribosome quality control (RQC) complex YloA/Tae2 family protein